jgi:hypothetical protein
VGRLHTTALRKRKDELMPSSNRPAEEQQKVRPFDPLVLDRAMIAIPLLNEMQEDLDLIRTSKISRRGCVASSTVCFRTSKPCLIPAGRVGLWIVQNFVEPTYKLLRGRKVDLPGYKLPREEAEMTLSFSSFRIRIAKPVLLEQATDEAVFDLRVVRCLTTLTYFVTQGHLLEKPSGPPFLAQCFRLGALLLVAGLLLPVALPGYRLANLHLTFIGGFSIILFTVSTRVILGHAGQSHLFRKKLRFLMAALALLVVATIARVAADFIAPARNSHLVYAALIWLLAATVWLVALGPKLSLSDE